MVQVFPTKSNLLNAKKSLELAKLGYDLMDKKRNILMNEMMGLIEEVNDLQGKIRDAYKRAFGSLRRANQTVGDTSSLALAHPVDDSIVIEHISVMGVEIPRISAGESSASISDFGFLGTSFAFDEACTNFAEVRELIIRLAQVESSARRIAEAIGKTRKRSNALENIIIPQFEDTIRYISSELEEKEREEFSKLKVIKSKKK